jgi:glycerate 2-kinase
VTGAGPLLDWHRAALAAVHGGAAVRAALAGGTPPQRPVHVLALGKAAEAMLRGAAGAWPQAIARALVVAPAGSLQESPPLPFPVRRQPGNHPVPGAESLAAGAAVAGFLQGVPAAEALLVLLSGGASSLAELPREGVDLPLLRELNTRLLAAGVDIRVMNALRGRFSRLKAGGAVGLCPAEDIRVLFISDVPGDAPAAVGSGPFWPPEDTAVATAVPEIGWPELEGLLRRLPPAPRSAARPAHRLVASNGDARAAVAAAARAAGLQAWDHGLFPEGSGLRLACRVVRFLRNAPAGVHVWGGEAPVRLPERPGCGGRAQHLAALLLLLWRARGWPRPIAVLSAATDGVDGNSGAAGAWFRDGRPESAAGMRAALRQALRRADTATFWQGLEQVVPSAETGTNVMDLLIVQVGVKERGVHCGRPVGRKSAASSAAKRFHRPGAPWQPRGRMADDGLRPLPPYASFIAGGSFAP